MPCKMHVHIIDTIYINIYKNNFIFHSFYLQKCKGLRNGHNYLIIAEFMKRKIEGDENKYMKLEV